MKFEDALMAMREGKEARAEHVNRSYIIKGGNLYLISNSETIHKESLSEYEILSESWEIVVTKITLFDVLKRIQEGSTHKYRLESWESKYYITNNTCRSFIQAPMFYNNFFANEWIEFD